MSPLLAFLALATASQPTLENTTQTLTNLSLSADTITSGRAMTLPRLRIAGGKVKGSTGC